MLSKQDLFYIQILKDFVHKEKTNKIDDIDWEKIIEYARIQNTSGIVFYQCKDYIPQELYKSLYNAYAAEIYAYGQRISLTKQITDEFKKNNIDYFIIKGPIVSLYYPVPALRTMGDTDFVVHENDMDKASSILKDLGYSQIESENELAFFKDGKEVEIHCHMIYPSKTRSIEETILCDRAWEFVSNNKLDETFHFMYLLLHLKRHLFGIGVGIRPFMDLAIILNNTDIDFSFIDKEFEKLNLINFKNVCLSFVAKWFNVGKDIVNIDDDFFIEQTNEILKNGSHGHQNKDNKLNNAFKAISGKENKLNTKNRFKYIKEVLFPSYESMIKIDSYQFIKDKKYLIVIAWLYRFVLSIINNKAIKQISNTISSVFLSKKIMDKKQKSRNNWGI